MERDSGRAAPATDRQALAVALLVTWIVGSMYLLAWANQTGRLENDIFTPWHLPLYLGIGAVVIYLIGLARRAVSQRHPRGLVPPEFAGTVVGAAMLVLYLPLDVVWASLAGLPQDFERTTALPRLFFGVAIMLLAGGPITEALRRAPGRRFGAAALALVLAAGSVGATIAFFTGSWSAWSLEAGLRQTPPLIPGTESVNELHRLTIDERSNEVIATGPDLREPALSQDGERIAAVSWGPLQPGDDRGRAEIEIMGADGAGRRKLTSDGEWKGVPAWSPDGSKIAYMATTFRSQQGQPEASFGPQQAPEPGGKPAPLIFSGPGGDWDIDVVDVASGAVETLAGGPSQEGRPAWSPDGKKVVFYSSQAGSLDLWLLDLASGQQTRLTDDPGQDWGASWSPDGSTLVYTSQREGPHRIFALDLASGKNTRLTDGPNEDWAPALSPDGQWIVFVSDRSTKTELWLMAADGSGVRRLTNTWDRYPEMTVGGWTPDSSAIFFVSRELFTDEGPTPDDRLAIASFALAGAIFGVVVGLLFAAGGTFPLGATLAVLLAFGLTPLAALQPRWLVAAIVSGLAVDGAAWLLRRQTLTTVRTAGLAALAAATWSIAFFVVGDQTGELRWEFNLLATALVLASLTAFAAAAAIASGRRRVAESA